MSANVGMDRSSLPVSPCIKAHCVHLISGRTKKGEILSIVEFIFWCSHGLPTGRRTGLCGLSVVLVVDDVVQRHVQLLSLLKYFSTELFFQLKCCLLRKIEARRAPELLSVCQPRWSAVSDVPDLEDEVPLQTGVVVPGLRIVATLEERILLQVVQLTHLQSVQGVAGWVVGGLQEGALDIELLLYEECG